MESGTSRADGVAAAYRLSPRERGVLELVSRGLTNGQIARELSLSVHGVKFHLGSIFRKLGVQNRTAATALYLQEGHLPADSHHAVD